MIRKLCQMGWVLCLSATIGFSATYDFSSSGSSNLTDGEWTLLKSGSFWTTLYESTLSEHQCHFKNKYGGESYANRGAYVWTAPMREVITRVTFYGEVAGYLSTFNAAAFTTSTLSDDITTYDVAWSKISSGAGPWWGETKTLVFPVESEVKSIGLGFYDTSSDATHQVRFSGIVIETVTDPQPIFSPADSVILGPTAITISSVEGAHIYYTLNGDIPTANDIPYAGPVTVNPGDTLQAIAVVDGVASKVTSQTYVLPEVYDYATTYNLTDGRWILAKSGSYWNTLYNASLADHECLIWNQYDGEHYPNRGAYVWTIPEGQVITQFSYYGAVAGYLDTFNAAVFTSTERNADISTYDVAWSYYSLMAGTWWGESRVLNFNVWDQIRSVGVGFYDTTSDNTHKVKFNNMVISTSPDPKPVFSPAGPEIAGPTNITISSPIDGDIYYTLDESDPLTNGLPYTGPIPVTNGSVLKAVLASGENASQVASQTYVFPRAEAPVFAPAGKYISGPTAITISSSTPDAMIYYTLNNTTPTLSSTLYTGPVTVSDGTTLKAIAVAENYRLSNVTSVTYVDAPETNRGHWWVGRNPFQINAVAEYGASLPLYHSVGFSSYMGTIGTNATPASMFGAAADVGLGWHWFYRGEAEVPTANFMATFADYLTQYPGMLGVSLGNESDPSEYPALAALANQVKTLAPDVLVYHPLLGYSDFASAEDYNAYLDQAIQVLGVDVLMHNHYPFNGGSTDGDFYQNLAIIREKALAAGIPYWNWLQGHGWNQPPTYSLRQEPSESEVRLQAFMSLAYGYSGLSYWTYTGTYAPYTNAILNSSATLSPIGLAVQDAIDEIKNIGNVTKDLTSTGVFYVTASGESQPIGTSAWTPQAGYSITNVTVNSGSKGFVIGLFEGDDDKEYFMVVNGNHAAYTSAADTAASVTITFDSSVDTITRINRVTGEHEEVTLTNHALSNYSLPGGTGDLFCLTLGGEPIPGDANRDGGVTFEDFAILQNHYGQSVTGDTWAQGDFNGDGQVTFQDFAILQNHYGQGSGMETAAAAEALNAGVPCGSPGLILLPLIGLGALSLRRQN